VMLNAMVPSPGEPPGAWWSNTGFAKARAEQVAQEGRDPSADDPREIFFHDVPTEILDEAWERGEPNQSGAPFTRPWSLTEWPKVPTRFLQGRDDRFFPVEFQRRVVRERLGLAPDEMDGGHLVALSRPQELADRLEAYRQDAAESSEK
jgi:pimeloyl-ACP methyl ester carboxylesterase